MEIITYSLQDGEKRSEQFYQDVAIFADDVLTEAAGRTGPLVEAFQTYLQQTRRETVRSQPEYTFELLTLGVLWQIYAVDALGLSILPQRILASLARLRRRRVGLKPAIDLVRGLLMSLFLLPHASRFAESPAVTLDHLDKLLAWLAATGDFRQEVKRLRLWRDFLAGQPPARVDEYLTAAVYLADWFETHSEDRLGRYTPNVEQFLAETHPHYRWHENVIFCGRRRVEYHLNMVGTHILNQAYRQAFLDTARKLVLAPPCMKAQPDARCQAQQTPMGARCTGCTPGCRVHQLTKLGEKFGFDVLIMPHELTVFSNGALKPEQGARLGVVGLACALTNCSGGWETKALGIPAQGVLLDYCGCCYHWHKEGIPTDINFRQLLQVLDIDRSPEKQAGEQDKGEVENDDRSSLGT